VSGGESAVAYELPRVPASAGALLWDEHGSLLVLKPTYKAGWTLPGGVMEDDGESPWQACQREVAEETGLVVHHGELRCVDFRRPRPGRPGGLRFLFDCGVMDHQGLGALALQESEIAEAQWVTPEQALHMLAGPVRRRVRAVLRHPRRLHYLEDGRRVRPA